MKKLLARLEQLKLRSSKRFVDFAHKPNAERWLAFFSFSEASFFPLPPDPFLIALLMVRVSRWIYYSALTTIFSVLGGAFGYLIGAVFFGIIGQQIINFYNLENEILYIAEAFSNNAFLTIFAAAFTPIPYKVFTIAAGFFKVNPVVFILACIAGRGLRFFIIGYAVKLYGDTFRRLLYRYFNLLTVIVLIAIALFLVLA